MKKVLSIIMLVLILVTSSFAQTNTNTTKDTYFKIGGMLFLSLQNWHDLNTTDSKFGFGINGSLFLGAQMQDLYLGVGPHLGYNMWSHSESVYNYTASFTTGVTDLGLELGGAWDGFYVTIGGGSSDVNITASVNNDSKSYDVAKNIGYTRVAFGFYDGFAIGIAFMSYSDSYTPNNLNRFELNLGFGF